jgi:hypothetical protein
MKHTQEKCTDKNCDGCNGMTCNLFVCSVCGAYEGGLATECPGEKISYELQQQIYNEEIDFINGKWKILKNKRDSK